MTSRVAPGRHLHLLPRGDAVGARSTARDASHHDNVAPMTDDQQLSELMALTARGDEAAFAQVYDAMAGRVYGLARRVVRDPAQAEEVVQEVMLEVWRKAARYTAALGSVRAWIMTITHRRAVDRVRSAQAAADRDLIAGTSGALAPPRPYDQVAEQVLTNLDGERVRAALATLTELQRQAIVLAYYGGRTQADVAAVLGVPLGTVKTRTRDGLIRLRGALGVDEDTPGQEAQP